MTGSMMILKTIIITMDITMDTRDMVTTMAQLVANVIPLAMMAVMDHIHPTVMSAMITPTGTMDAVFAWKATTTMTVLQTTTITHHITVVLVMEHVEDTATDRIHVTARYVVPILTKITGVIVFVMMDTMATIVATIVTITILITQDIVRLCAMAAMDLKTMIVWLAPRIRMWILMDIVAVSMATTVITVT